MTIHEFAQPCLVRAPAAYLGEPTGEQESFPMTSRLNAAADDCEHFGIGAREGTHGDGRYSRSSRLGDVSSVHHRLERSRRRVEKHDDGLVRRKTTGAVGFEYRDQFCADRGIGCEIRRHASEERPIWSYLDDRADRLSYLSARKRRECRFHGFDEVGHGDQCADLVFVQLNGHILTV